ncbi:HAMP domain-containing histidine kinase [Dehalobacter sp. DCM]|uniref:sensor histidine kinase n=1 Tax=Dehalobacter sp. DCM TaxID=2907827 RepID=UPI003081758A|nr:HAMP domain-containing histidine kinase [Dehalobacter sp. DCM]
MKSMMKILLRYVFSAAGIALILLVVNFTVLVVWTIQSTGIAQKDYSIAQFADGLTLENGVYTLSEPIRDTITTQYQWAMLIANDGGKVIWSLNLPGDVPRYYTVTDIASFSRWYLNDYPVTVWARSEGLFVLGREKGSVWKYSIEEQQTMMDNFLACIPAVLLLNGFIAVLLALLFGLRLFRSLKPLAKGIEDMAENRPVALSTKGLLGALASRINQTSDKLITQEAALKKRDDARTTWIAGVSHDIRTPLSIVMGYASQLEEDPELPPAKREQAGVIRSHSERIKALVSDLNLASKLEYDMQPLRKKTVSLAVLLRGVTAGFINGGLPNGYTIDIKINDNTQNFFVEGDEELLKRALSNLIGNSIKHNPDGCAIKVALQRDGMVCTLQVSDNGTGFRQDLLENLNTSQNPSELPNRGLGLTIVRQIIKVHGGTTACYNLPQGGGEAVLSLPGLAGKGG